MDSSADDANKLSHATRRAFYFNYPTRNDPAVLLRSNEGEYRAYSRSALTRGVQWNSMKLSCGCAREDIWAIGKSFGSNTEMIASPSEE